VSDDTFCLADYVLVEDRDHLFFNCSSYGRLWLLIPGWLGIYMAFHGTLLDHSIQFGGLGGFSKNSCVTFNII